VELRSYNIGEVVVSTTVRINGPEHCSDHSRVFTNQDDAANKFAIVNERTAAHYWPSENAIGKHVKIGIGGVDGDCEIVGVV